MHNNLHTFIKLNLTQQNLFNTYTASDRSLLLDSLYNKERKFDITFLESFDNTRIKEDVLRNFEIAQDIIKNRTLVTEPLDGDVYIDDNNNKFRIVETYRGNWQFCEEGSFYINSEGQSTMSGGFAFNVKINTQIVGSTKTNKLLQRPGEEHRKFWFFQDSRSGAHRAIYFIAPVKTYKSIFNF